MLNQPRWRRVFDLALALPLAIVALPLGLILLVLVRIDSPGAPIFVQTRVGRARRLFTVYKIRTMRSDTPDGASHEVGTATVTRIGMFLRLLKLDELPQLINVIAGSMSLVGPRPCLPSQTELIHERASRGVFVLRPGITGPAQVKGIDMSTPRELAEVEAAYFQRAGVFSDFAILCQTVTGAGRGDAARAR